MIWIVLPRKKNIVFFTLCNLYNFIHPLHALGTLLEKCTPELVHRHLVLFGKCITLMLCINVAVLSNIYNTIK